MSEKKRSLKSLRIGLMLLAAVFLMGVILAALKVTFGPLFLAILGFGALIFFHELGHFTAAKLTGIKIEAFSVGFPPTLISIMRTEGGYLIRLFPKNDEEGNPKSDSGSFSIGKKAKQGETEYRIGMIPFGGFVKMLGQDDTKVTKTDDPRAYINKPIWARMMVIIAGVTCNAILALILFMVVFFYGVEDTPPVIGDVSVGYPAEKAGLQPGDEIVEIDGRTMNLKFMHLSEAAMFCGENRAAEMTVSKVDGSLEKISMTPVKKADDKFPKFGIAPVITLKIDKVKPDDAKLLEERTNLRPGDTVVGVNGIEVKELSDLRAVLADIYDSKVKLLSQRLVDGKTELIEAELQLEYNAGYADGNEIKLSNICSVVPLLKVSGSERVKYVGNSSKIKKGDIILRIDDVNYPTFFEMREVTKKFGEQELSLLLMGDGKKYETKVIPQKVEDEVFIGIGLSLEMDKLYVAKYLEGGEDGDSKYIPRGAKITAVNDTPVVNFSDVIQLLKLSDEQRVSVSYELNTGDAGTSYINADSSQITVNAVLADNIPWTLFERTYKANDPLEAIQMGFYETIGFFKHVALTIRALVTKTISPKGLIGPVGILHLTYEIASRKSFTFYLYIIALFNACIAVMNSLPFLPFDGGHIVMLAVEKVRGKPLEERIQAGLIYVGLVLVLAFAIYVTFNDVVRWITGSMF